MQRDMGNPITEETKKGPSQFHSLLIESPNLGVRLIVGFLSDEESYAYQFTSLCLNFLSGSTSKSASISICEELGVTRFLFISVPT